MFERVFLDESHPFVGYQYWNLSKFDFVDEGKLLIVGGGDGALQDFLLSATKKDSAKEIFLDLGLNDTQLIKLERSISEIEQKLIREAIWWSKGDPDNRAKKTLCSLNREAQRIHEAEAEELLNSPAVVNKLNNIIRPSAWVNLELAYPCDHFTGCYALNRFLAVLIGKHIGETKPVLLPNSRVTSVESAVSGHDCRRDADDCIDFEHQAVIKNGFHCCGVISGLADDTETYQSIFLRLGIREETVPLVFDEKPAAPGLQVMPYSLP